MCYRLLPMAAQSSGLRVQRTQLAGEQPHIAHDFTELRLRSLARLMADCLLQQAEAEGRAAVYLLTETAAGYFSGLGFRIVERRDVPPAISRTRQFSSLCPDSASCMVLPLPRA